MLQHWPWLVENIKSTEQASTAFDLDTLDPLASPKAVRYPNVAQAESYVNEFIANSTQDSTAISITTTEALLADPGSFEKDPADGK